MKKVDYEGRIREELGTLTSASADGKHDRDPVALDQQSVGRLSRMDAMQQQAMAIATEQRRQARIRALQAALERIADNEFGVCRRCGENIPEKRLELDPTITSCVTCLSAGN